ncbi:AAA family ATPase [Mucilaginibacter sp.]|uniref:AAA family ATPase n=1 Tax=Mucilaginibacter sp. TaxID=1882438 RepID=UPI0026113452|nr:AAA family ATPase [Mucilaginibacter sp.]MDB4919166.1 putative ATPase [Mucilaginibacter sp.]
MSKENIESKISEAQQILSDLGLEKHLQNRICALTLLALSNLKPESQWKNAHKRSMIISKDIMEFANEYYKADYKPNSRESFRKLALKPFVENTIAVLNPDDPELSTTSSKTHYALSDIALKAILKFNSKDWNDAVQEFKQNQTPDNKIDTTQLRSIEISNYKSILNDKIELGRFNVFIGENGCGKSNILEAIAVIGAAKANDLNFDGLYSRGIRIARPDLMLSSFLGATQSDRINIQVGFNTNQGLTTSHSSIYPEKKNEIYTKWIDGVLPEVESDFLVRFRNIIYDYEKSGINVDFETAFKEVFEKSEYKISNKSDRYIEILSEYGIFDLNTKSLRGITPSDSRKTPLGLNGEGLDLLISSFNSFERDYLKKSEMFFKWLDGIISDKDDKNKLLGLKPGRSTSTLYFSDKYMLKKNNVLSAENSNEGILHVLFYLSLFISNKTPKLFGIDNIETALNPRLCQRLIMELAILSKERGKQAIITTHNPAVLDGLNLFDDEQRLFVVYRNSEGHTKTRRVKFKEDLKDKPLKISEMWMRGSLGGVPDNF